MAITHHATIVIGAGSGGLTVALGLAQLGRDVALIEKHWVGGDCTNVGCIPSKTLIHAADEHARHSNSASTAAAVFALVQRKRDQLRDDEAEHVTHTPHLRFYHGTARLVGPKQLEVLSEHGERHGLSADNIVIATGSRPRALPIAGLPPERLLTNENLFELPRAPQHLAIVGAGPIGLEMAFALRNLGSRVSVITNDERVFSSAPVAASEVLHASLCEHGIDVYHAATVTGYEAASQTLMLSTPHGSVALAPVDKVLVAVGRQRNVDTVGLEHSGVHFDLHKGIAVNGYGETNIRGVYALGDVTPQSRWTHSANAQGRRVVQRIAFPLLPALAKEPLYPNTTFSDPEVANVGLMPDEISKRYHPKLIKTLRWDLSKTDKGYTEGLQHGFVQVYALRLTGRILGATIVGPRAGEMISFFTLAISEGVSLYKLFRLVYPYPTLSGAIQKVADQYVRETLPAVHIELFDVARYGLATAWQRMRGGTFPSPTAAQHEPLYG